MKVRETEFGRFLEIASGSATEVEYLLNLTHDLKYLKDPEFNELDDEINEIKRMLATLIKKIRTES